VDDKKLVYVLLGGVATDLGGGVLRFRGSDGGVRGRELPDIALHSCQYLARSGGMYMRIQVVEFQDVGMAVRGSNHFALRCRRLLVPLTVG
jgi:hypothetical protein